MLIILYYALYFVDVAFAIYFAEREEYGKMTYFLVLATLVFFGVVFQKDKK